MRAAPKRLLGNSSASGCGLCSCRVKVTTASLADTESSHPATGKREYRVSSANRPSPFKRPSATLFEAEQGADLEIAGGDVDAAGDLAPVGRGRRTFQSASLLSTMNRSLLVWRVRWA
jgi:hypothetical protein